MRVEISHMPDILIRFVFLPYVNETSIYLLQL